MNEPGQVCLEFADYIDAIFLLKLIETKMLLLEIHALVYN